MDPQHGPPLAARLALVAAGAALVVYAGLTLVPPPAASQWPPLPDAPLLDRLFPAVPAEWVLARLGAIAIALLAVAWAAISWRDREAVPPPVAPSVWPEPDRRWSAAAVGVAVLQVFVSFFASSLPRAGQLAFVAALALPSVLLAVACRGRRPRGAAGGDPTHWPLVLVVLLVWVAVRGPAALHSPLIATQADAVVPFEGARRVLDPAFDLLGGQQFPGYTSLLSLLQGPILVGLAPEDLTPAFLQIVQIFWLAVAATLVARLVAGFGVAGAAPVAAAAFLFAPLTAFATILLGPLYLGALVPGALLCVALVALRDGRVWAVAASGVVAGAATTHPSIAPLGLLSFAGLGLVLWSRRPPKAAVAAALLGFVAVVVPGLPSPTSLAGLASNYADSTRMWTGIEALGLGVAPTEAAEFHRGLGFVGPADIALGVALSPWATPRTAMRLWGDTVFDPLGAGLFTIGLAAALFGAWNRRLGWGLVLFGLVALLPGLLSSYDRPSLTRPLALPLAVALLAGFGFAWLARTLRRRTALGLAMATALAIAVAGTYQFDVLNRRILPMAAVSIAVGEVDGRHDCAPSVLLNTGAWDVQAAEFFARMVPRCPLDVVVVGNGNADWIDAASRRAVAFWSPGVEAVHDVAGRICAADPAARVWTIRDRSGLGFVHAAALGASAWEPVPDLHTAERHDCSEPLATEARRAQRALAEAGRLAASGDAAGARERLRATAVETFLQKDLYAALARTGGAEAVYWARRAVHVADWHDVDSILLLAELQADAGDVSAARATLAQGIREARGREDAAGALRLEAEAAALGARSARAVVGPRPSCYRRSGFMSERRQSEGTRSARGPSPRSHQ